MSKTIEIYYITALILKPQRRTIIITDDNGDIIEFNCKTQALLWLNKNKNELSPDAIYTPTPGVRII